MNKVAILIFSCALLSTQNVMAQEAPLGLHWSASAETLKQAGIDLKESGSDDFGVGFVAQKVPEGLSDQETTLLSFGYNDKLWRIVIVSKSFPNDPTGIAVRNRYAGLVRILSEKYGKPKVHQILGGLIYSEPQYFLAGIEGGNSFWYSNFETSDLFIQIGILAATSSDARWRIIYEYKPLKETFVRAKKGREKGRL